MKRLVLLTTTMAFVAATITLPVSAQTDSTQQTNTQTTTQQQSSGNITDRLKQRKEALKTKLDAAAQNRLKLRCKAAQGKVSSVATRANTNLENREDRYTKVVDRLDELTEQLKAKNVDTAALETLVTQLGDAVENFKAQADDFRTAVNDLKAMDCTSDPEGFKATLETTRSERAELAKQAATIKQLVKQIRDQLTQARQSLAAQRADNTEDGGVQ